MSIRVISLKNLMQLMLAEPKLQRRLIKYHIRQARPRVESASGEGGDFHVGFWSDAKKHAAGKANLREATEDRIKKNKGRRRLYPLLTKGFLEWWEENRRRINEPFEIKDGSFKGRIELSGLGLVKVENNLAFSIGEDGFRVVYPYVCEEPEVDTKIGRLGLWAMAQAMPEQAIENLRILDVIRGRTFSIEECPLIGTEEEEFRTLYAAQIQKWIEFGGDET